MTDAAAEGSAPRARRENNTNNVAQVLAGLAVGA
jgi:hypothetical protein